MFYFLLYCVWPDCVWPDTTNMAECAVFISISVLIISTQGPGFYDSDLVHDTYCSSAFGALQGHFVKIYD